MQKYLHTLCFTFLVISLATAQDGHYSQYQNTLLFTNPALTGDLEYQHRIGASYRSQWANINVPYSTYGAFYDQRLKKLNLGLMINQNSAGIASIKTTNAVLSAAYKQRLFGRNNYLAIGGQLGIGQKRFDPTSFSFDNQIDPDNGFDPTLSSGETFANTSAIVPDLNIGVLWNFQRSTGLQGQFGLSFAHLTRSTASFYANNQVLYPRKTTFHGSVQFPFSSTLKIGPRLLVMSQENASEVMLGAQGRLKIQEEIFANFGIDARFQDAVVFQAGLDIRNITVGLSYDSNTSSLKNTTGGNGAIELTGIYRFGNRRAAVAIIDTDGDGISDLDDQCPTVAGIKKLKGCPPVDSDGDGILDKDDKCPTVPGIKRLSGCPPASPIDSDGDGILDKDDKCPTVPGIKRLNGCPPAGPVDSDGDGILDKDDRCPTVPGIPSLQGCPPQADIDSDGDGILDKNDKCPTVPGIPSLQGCPQNAVAPKDSDGDGILDNEDLCPYIPGVRAYQGCNDMDQDGVWDHVDVCPRIYGVVQNNGCPLNNRNLDSDGDGILDKDDKCVYLRGKVEHQGCPDSDQDGVSDIQDDCPFVKGVRENAGCPLANQPNISNPAAPRTTREVAIEGVEFDTDKSFIKPFYFPRLENVISIVKSNPNYRIVLSGHTDAEGNDMYNYQLGQRRAQAVQNYLVKSGISPHLIETRSYGEAIPKSTNNTEEGKARNRRTEIIVLEY